jgi:hypothetical protein
LVAAHAGLVAKDNLRLHRTAVGIKNIAKACPSASRTADNEMIYLLHSAPSQPK